MSFGKERWWFTERHVNPTGVHALEHEAQRYELNGWLWDGGPARFKCPWPQQATAGRLWWERFGQSKNSSITETQKATLDGLELSAHGRVAFSDFQQQVKLY